LKKPQIKFEVFAMRCPCRINLDSLMTCQRILDPAAPEYAKHLMTHEDWWSAIWNSQRARGMTESTLTPKFGPPPYLQTLPPGQGPVVDLGKICDWMATRQLQRFAEKDRSELQVCDIHALVDYSGQSI